MKERTDKKVNYPSPAIVELAYLGRSFYWKSNEKWQVVTVQGLLSPSCCRVNKYKRTRGTHVTWQEFTWEVSSPGCRTRSTGVHILLWKFRYAEFTFRGWKKRTSHGAVLFIERYAPQIFHTRNFSRCNNYAVMRCKLWIPSREANTPRNFDAE